MEWQTVPGSIEAQACINQYPTPRALRQAVRTQALTDILPPSLHRFISISAVNYFAALHAAIAHAAQDHDVWVSPSGNVTII